MKSQIVIAALLSALSVPAFAGHAAAQAAKEMVPLADGERCTSSGWKDGTGKSLRTRRVSIHRRLSGDEGRAEHCHYQQ